MKNSCFLFLLLVNLIHAKAPVLDTPQHEDLFKIVKEYKSYKQMCDVTFSGMHWNQDVQVYLNQGISSYVHNYKALELIGDEELSEELEDEHGEEALEKAVTFLSYPEGTVVVKEHYLTNVKEKDPVSYAIMIKRKKGFNSDSNDWEYAWVAKDRSILLKGVNDSEVVKNTCHNCHFAVKERDFLFGTALKDSFISK